MNFSIFHILKKDFRLCWRYLAAWWGLLLLKAYWIMVSIDEVQHPTPLSIYHPGAPHAPTFYQLFMEWLPACLMIFTYLNPTLLWSLVAAVLKADSPLDERALWRTRPVAGRKMLRAKLLFLGLFGLLVPCAIETVERLKFGFSVGECVRGFVETAVIEAALMSLFASAVLLFKRTITGVLAYVAIALAGIGAYAVFVHFHWLDGLMQNFVPTPQPGYLGLGTGFIFLTLVVATVLLVARQMYGGARQLQGAKTLLGGLVLAIAVALLCRSLFFSVSSIPYPPDNSLKLALEAFPPARDVSVPIVTHTAADGTSTTFGVTTDSLAPDQQMIYGWITTRSLPSLKDEVLRVTQVHSSLSWPAMNGPFIQDSFSDLGWNTLLLNAQASFAAAGYGRLAWDSVSGENSIPLSFFTATDIHRAQKEPARWSAELDCESDHLVKVADVLPRAGVSWQEGNLQYEFNQDVYLSPIRSLHADHTINLFFMQYGPVNYLLASPPPNDKFLQVFLLYNPHTKECIVADSGQPSNRTEPVPFFSIFYDTLREADFDFSNKLDENGQPLAQPMSDDDIKKWAADARLVVLRFEPARRFSTTVTIDSFLVPKDAAQTPAAKP